MKKIFVLFSLVALSLFTQAQQMSPAGGVTCISTTPNYVTIGATLSYDCASFQAVATRVSAAMGGTIVLQASNDGTNYISVPVNVGDTITIADAATSLGVINVTPTTGVLYKWYRLKIVGASTDTMTVKGWFNGRQ